MNAILFSKPLSHTDVSDRFAVPTHSLGMFPSFPDGGNKIKLLVWDDDAVDGKMFWEFTVIIRMSGEYPRPVFPKGWLEFVRAKGLNVGDVVKLYRKKGTKRLWGKDVCQLRYHIKVVNRADASGARSGAADAAA